MNLWQLIHFSIREIEYKLYSKGISSNIIEQYINNNLETLERI